MRSHGKSLVLACDFIGFALFRWRTSVNMIRICLPAYHANSCRQPIKMAPHRLSLFTSFEIRTRGTTKTELTSVGLLQQFRIVFSGRFIMAESIQRLLLIPQIVAGGLKCGIRVNRVDLSHCRIVAGSQLGVWWKWPTSESHPSTSSPPRTRSTLHGDVFNTLPQNTHH
jgi:hypothetical protein